MGGLLNLGSRPGRTGRAQGRVAVVALTVVCLVAAAGCRPDSVALPVVIGLPEVGHTLTATPGIWNGGPTSFAYTWESCEADVADSCLERQSGAGATYVVTTADEGRRLRVTVTGSNVDGDDAATSLPTAVVRPGADGSTAWHGWATSPGRERSLGELAVATEPTTAELTVDPADRHQGWLGVGGGLTDSSATLIEQAGPELTRVLFDPGDDAGARLSLARLPLSATDFSARHWSWQDDPDGPLRPPAEAFPALRVLLDAADLNPGLQAVGSAWSAPAWMKDSGQMAGGALAAGQEEAYGNLLVYQATLLRALGFPLAAITLGNEPGHSASDYPTMTMSDGQMIAMAQATSGPLHAAGIELWALDHNWSDRARADTLLAGAPGAFDAAAFHCYSGEPASMAGLPVPAVVTECSGGEWDPSWASTFRWQARNLVVDAVASGSTGLILWNLALDPSGGPHIGGCGNCRGVVTVDPATGGWAPQPEFFLLAHLSRAADPGATRIGLTGRPDVPAVAFANPDGTIGIFGHNDSAQHQVLSVTFPAGDAARVAVEPGELFTLRGSALAG